MAADMQATLALEQSGLGYLHRHEPLSQSRRAGLSGAPGLGQVGCSSKQTCTSQACVLQACQGIIQQSVKGSKANGLLWPSAHQGADVDAPVEPVEEGRLLLAVARVVLVELVSAKRAHARLDAPCVAARPRASRTAPGDTGAIK